MNYQLPFKKVMLLLLLLIPVSSIAPQGLSPRIESFIKDLLAGKESMDEYILDSELEKAGRLGIYYDGVENKYLISYDIDPYVKQKINYGGYSYTVTPEVIDGEYTVVNFYSPALNYSKKFYFYNDLYISPVTYHTRHWSNITTKYFDIYISRSALFNSYSAEMLDAYAESILSLLRVNENERQLLQQQKILYILCRDSREIKDITGFDTRGMYIPAFDEVVTIYNCHFHELSHLLINFRLKNLPLFTPAFLQEGFAVATGGRGGQARNIMLDAGYFLHSSGFIPFNSIIEQHAFYSEDASSAYPVAGLYSYYLLNTYGIESYLKLYMRYSGDSAFVNSLKVNDISLPLADEFDKFIREYTHKSGTDIKSGNRNFSSIYTEDDVSISVSEDQYKFSIKDALVFKTSSPIFDYKSRKFEELFPGKLYSGEKYAVTVNEREVSIYNLYTNILIASYYSGLTEGNMPVPFINGNYEFYIDRNIFEEDIDDLETIKSSEL